MKKAVFIFLVFLFSVNKTQAQGAKLDLAKEIIGEWTIVASRSVEVEKNDIMKVSETVCNVCRKATFKKDMAAEVKNAVGSIEKYDWKIVGDKIFFKMITNESESKTFDKEYLLKFNTEFDRLELIKEVDKSSLILSR